MLKSSTQLKLGALLSYVAIFVNLVSGLVFTPWMIAKLGQSDYAIYTLAYSLINLFIVDFGLGSAVSRYLSKYKAEGDSQKINNFLGIIYKLYILVDIVIFLIFVVLYIFLDKIYVELTAQEIQKLRVVFIMCALNSVLTFPLIPLGGILTSHEKFVQQKLADLVHRVLTVSLTAIALVNGMGLYALIIVNVISGIIINVYKLIVVKLTTDIKVNFRYSNRSLYKDIFGFSIFVTISTLASRLVLTITPTILGIVADSTAIAIFGVVSTMEGYSYLITTAINGLFLPKVSYVLTRDDYVGELNALILRVGRFQYALNGLIFAGFASVGRHFIALWIGNDYLDAYWGIILIMLPGLFFNSLHIAETALIAQKKVHISAMITLVTGIVNVCLSFVLSGIYGVFGACLSICIAYVVRAVLIHVVYKKILDFNVWNFTKSCYIRMSPPILLSLLAGWGLHRLMPGGSWMDLIIKVGGICVVYFIVLFFVSLTRDERRGIIKKVFRT